MRLLLGGCLCDLSKCIVMQPRQFTHNAYYNFNFLLRSTFHGEPLKMEPALQPGLLVKCCHMGGRCAAQGLSTGSWSPAPFALPRARLSLDKTFWGTGACQAAPGFCTRYRKLCCTRSHHSGFGSGQQGALSIKNLPTGTGEYQAARAFSTMFFSTRGQWSLFPKGAFPGIGFQREPTDSPSRSAAWQSAPARESQIHRRRRATS